MIKKVYSFGGRPPFCDKLFIWENIYAINLVILYILWNMKRRESRGKRYMVSVSKVTKIMREKVKIWPISKIISAQD